jgi:hypothetical protein
VSANRKAPESKVGLNWGLIKEVLERLPWKGETPGMMVRKHPLGTVMGMAPSGKYYSGWTEDEPETCSECKVHSTLPCGREHVCTGATGDPLTGNGHCEGCVDAAWKMQLESEAGINGMYIESGDNPWELNACQFKEVNFCRVCGTNYPGVEWNMCLMCNIPLTLVDDT